MSRNRTSKAPDPQVGRGKPPKHSQCKPGQSGNPGGRTKGSKNDKTTTAMRRSDTRSAVACAASVCRAGSTGLSPSCGGSVS
ncbi:DUF5681 domain-containing protein [Acuticoccus sediminis]|uniref:DUF5681 domain-containing protein n=1 Tax=Acuticoccus sediminis TaxID=2184697 RepID=UPI0026B2AE83